MEKVQNSPTMRSGNLKTYIPFDDAGLKKMEYPYCYTDAVGENKTNCTFATHGCQSGSNTCLNDQCVAGDHDTNDDSKKNYSVTCHSNNSYATRIDYYSDGTTKFREFTYYKNGNPKTVKANQANDATKKYKEVSYYKNGSIKTSIGYYDNGILHNENTYYKSNGKLKTSISYLDADNRTGEETYYESGNEKTIVAYLPHHSPPSFPISCYLDKTGTESERKETCTQSKHGCTESGCTDASCTCISP